MHAYIFPGQGSQFSGMGLSLYQKSALAKELFDRANSILGFEITKIMFAGTEQELKQTKVTQPAIFLHATILAAAMDTGSKPDMVAGHSLGEFSALVANGCLDFEDALLLVSKRAQAMQKACTETPSAMAAILGLKDELVIAGCEQVDGVVVAANYNCPGQVVISGEKQAVAQACDWMKAHGAKRALVLPVGGAFHSPLMLSAKKELSEAIEHTNFKTPSCPIYQNVTAKPITNPVQIRQNLIDQLTAPVQWTKTIENMIADGATQFTEVGPGKVLSGLVKKIERSASVSLACSS